jgi:hypothetical protein
VTGWIELLVADTRSAILLRSHEQENLLDANGVAECKKSCKFEQVKSSAAERPRAIQAAKHENLECFMTALLVMINDSHNCSIDHDNSGSSGSRVGDFDGF